MSGSWESSQEIPYSQTESQQGKKVLMEATEFTKERVDLKTPSPVGTGERRKMNEALTSDIMRRHTTWAVPLGLSGIDLESA